MVGFEGEEGESGMVRSRGLYSVSSGGKELLSVEKGVFKFGNGKRWSRCLAIRLKRCCVEGASFSDCGGAAAGYVLGLVVIGSL